MCEMQNYPGIEFKQNLYISHLYTFCLTVLFSLNGKYICYYINRSVGSDNQQLIVQF